MSGLSKLCNYGYFLSVAVSSIIGIPVHFLRRRWPRVKDISKQQNLLIVELGCCRFLLLRFRTIFIVAKITLSTLV